MWIWPFSVLIVWYLCSVPNLFKISVIVTEIDALCFWHSFDDVTRINFRFRLLVSGHLRMVAMHLPIKFGTYIFIQSGVIDILPKFKWRQPPSWIFSLCEIGHFGMLVVWYLCSVPNLVQISVTVIEIDALILQTSFDDVTRINFRFRLLVTRSSPHGRDASSHKRWCRYLYFVRSYWHFSEIQDGGRRHLGFSVYVNLAILAWW